MKNNFVPFSPLPSGGGRRSTTPPQHFFSITNKEPHRGRELLSSPTMLLEPMSAPAVSSGWGNKLNNVFDRESPEPDPDVDGPIKLTPLDRHHISLSPISAAFTGDLSTSSVATNIDAAGNVFPKLTIESRFPRPFSPLTTEPKQCHKLENIDLDHSFGEGEIDEVTGVTKASRTPNRTKSVPHFTPSFKFQTKDDSSFKVVCGLGLGGYASVLLCHHCSSDKLYSMKVIPKKRVSKMGERVRIKRELRALTELKPSPFLLRCYSAFETSNAVFFVCDYFQGGDLFFHLSARSKAGFRGFDESDIRVTLAEVALGISHLHDHNYIHRDIKAENVMLDSRGHAKLVDFGLAKELPSSSSRAGEKCLQEFPLSVSGSLIYMSPELIRDGTGGRHTDWWAYGILAHELLTGRTPWSSLTNKKLIKKEIKSLRIPTPMNLRPPAGLFVCSLLRRNPSHRLGTCTSVTTAPFFNTINWSKVSSLETSSFFDQVEVTGKRVDRKSSSMGGGFMEAQSSSHRNGSDSSESSDHQEPRFPFRVEDCEKSLDDYVKLSNEILEGNDEELDPELEKDKIANRLNEVGINKSGLLNVNTADESQLTRTKQTAPIKEGEWSLGLELIASPPQVMSEANLEEKHLTIPFAVAKS